MEQKNQCRYCNRTLSGLTVCECSESLKYREMWKNSPRNKKEKIKYED